MSRLVVQRQSTDNKTYILGEMTLDGQHVCYTLEPAYERIPHPAIPAGTYPLTLQVSGEVYGWMSPALTSHAANAAQVDVAASFKEDGVPLLQNVPGRGGVEIHIGNFPKDTLGCTLVGAAQGAGEVTGSTEQYYSTYPVISDYIKSDADHTIDYLDIPEQA